MYQTAPIFILFHTDQSFCFKFFQSVFEVLAVHAMYVWREVALELWVSLGCGIYYLLKPCLPADSVVFTTSVDMQ